MKFREYSRRWKRSMSAVLMLGILPGFLLIGCSNEPHWKFQGRVVDQSGIPLSNVLVVVTLTPNLHAVLVEKVRSVRRLLTDNAGMFPIDYRCTVLTLEVEKQDYVKNKYVFFPSDYDPKDLPPTKTITLIKDISIPAADDLDKLGHHHIVLKFDRGTNAISVNLLDNSVGEGIDSNAVMSIRLEDHRVAIRCMDGAVASVIDWEPGIEVESWMENHRVMSRENLVKDFTLPSRFIHSGPAISGAFFLDIRQNERRVYCARIYLTTVTPEEYALDFNLSRDEFFVVK